MKLTTFLLHAWDFSIERDWGSATEEVEAIARILAQAVPEDYIIACYGAKASAQGICLQPHSNSCKELALLRGRGCTPRGADPHFDEQSPFLDGRARIWRQARNGMKDVIRIMVEAKLKALDGKRSAASTGEFSRL